MKEVKQYMNLKLADVKLKTGILGLVNILLD